MYEILLGSKGIMQLGWATLQCKFTNEVCHNFIVNFIEKQIKRQTIRKKQVNFSCT